MIEKYFNVIRSTSNSLLEYEYRGSKNNIKVGGYIILTNVKTKQVKKFDIEFIKREKQCYVLKNMNNTLVLKVK